MPFSNSQLHVGYTSPFPFTSSPVQLKVRSYQKSWPLTFATRISRVLVRLLLEAMAENASCSTLGRIELKTVPAQELTTFDSDVPCGLWEMHAGIW